ncbi:uncharacterized protein NECHADRAFT_79861 [Fusarium vanettenii 77-13-4]|uniref:Zn(2)-C6 fungal-type domain-containing protein n=1 Tax=Fusarium vanettenii (strain ATCC MYA-4622 / CBS 123669 / FGSC 9596 / NRRL 45880 / 77-13-4) TaxID=660122 RepID=C7Z0E2_FUSV7|nr:uncharacterized protein NECHADRAFT_79861 [Fusarium vanettenii 77-13-4]EEU42367.1 predicted protein [Fusarium vanettenii 77-13-4]
MPLHDSAQIAKAGKRRSKGGRSRLGCLTCRAKHVKCDERLPVCRRCERLRLDCSPHWTQDHGTRSSLRILPPQTLQPKRRIVAHELGPALQDNHIQRSDDDLQWTIFDELSGDTVSTLFLGNTDSVSGTMPQWEHPETPAQTTATFLRGEEAMSCIATQSSSQPLPTINRLALPSTELLVHGGPDGLILGHEEFGALRHYQDEFCKVHTSKTLAWSFPVLLLEKASHSSLTIRCAVAVSLQDLDMRRRANGFPPSGATEVMHQPARTVDHIEALATFYFQYVYLTHRPTINKAELLNLSGAVVRYLQASSIVEALTRPASASATAMSPSLRSFLSRLLLWVYREDVYATGYGCSGKVARYFSERPKLIRRMGVISRPMYQLNWGTRYPTEQRLDDVFCAQHLDMLVRLIELESEITEFGWSTMGSDSTRTSTANSPHIEEKMSRIELDFSATFQMITMPDDNYPTSVSSLVQGVAVFVTIYYAWKLTYHRIAGMPEDKIQDVLSLLMQAVQHTIPKIQLKDLQRALLVAVMETRNPIHKEWIMSKLEPRWKAILSSTLDRDTRRGRRTTIWTLHECASDINGNW